MKYKICVYILCSFIFCMSIHGLHDKNIGLLIVATGKYIRWVQPLINSADIYFLKNQQVTYFIFTDAQEYLQNKTMFHSKRPVIVLSHNRLGWPYDTMMRPKVYYEYRNQFMHLDYMFALDADMLFVDEVGDEILGELVATQHPGFVGKRGTYETRKISTAYVASNEGDVYFAGGFNGGLVKKYLQLCKKVTENIEKDLEKNVIAVWHDESHINRYFIDNHPQIILSPSYCYPESWQLPYRKKLLALDKNHSEVRQ